ncbi:MAG: polymer-forming cytoskeletal protein [Acidobacteriota bacterium]|jgi:cytoskeletal protein CcmA (bactofilin family)
MGIGKTKTGNDIVSILGKGTEINGEISFTSGMRVDGVIKGKVRSEQSIIIGPSGKIDAEVDICNISINGEFRGIIRATERVEIHKEGKVFGDIFSPCLIIEAGATFEGRCNMGEGDIQKEEENTDPDTTL